MEDKCESMNRTTTAQGLVRSKDSPLPLITAIMAAQPAPLPNRMIFCASDSLPRKKHPARETSLTITRAPASDHSLCDVVPYEQSKLLFALRVSIAIRLQ